MTDTMGVSNTQCQFVEMSAGNKMAGKKVTVQPVDVAHSVYQKVNLGT